MYFLEKRVQGVHATLTLFAIRLKSVVVCYNTIKNIANFKITLCSSQGQEQGGYVMSYAIIRNAKYKSENLKGIYRHNERRNTNYSNKNIDKDKIFISLSPKKLHFF